MSSLVPIYSTAQSGWKLDTYNSNSKTTVYNSKNLNNYTSTNSKDFNFVIPLMMTVAATFMGIINSLKTKNINPVKNPEKKLTEITNIGVNALQDAQSKKLLGYESEIIERGKSIISRENSILEAAKKEYDEVISIIKKFQEKSFQNFIDTKEKSKIIFSDFSDNIQKIMDEYQNGRIIRRTIFDPTKITISSIEKDVTNGPNGVQNIKEAFSYFMGDKLSSYGTEVNKTANGSTKAGEIFSFLNNCIVGFKKNWEEFSSGAKRAGESFDFKNHNLYEYNKGYKRNALGKISIAEFFRNNIW